MLQKEAKSSIVAGELLVSTKEVMPDMYSEITANPLPISSIGKLVTEYMKMVKYNGVCEGEKPLLQFHNYAPRKAYNLLSMASLLGSEAANIQEIDAKTQPLRVNCGCSEYKTYFADANYELDVQYGIRIATTPGFNSKGEREDINPKQLPGMCRHILSLYICLKDMRKIA